MKRGPPNYSNDSANTNQKTEEQFILRVPPRVAQQIREMMNQATSSSGSGGKKSRGPKDRELGIEIDVEQLTDPRNAVMKVGNEHFVGTFVNLPCVIESMKTYDNVNYFKSADIGQMLLIHDPDQKEEDLVINYDSEYNFASGITPPARNIRRRKFRKTAEWESQHEQIELVEHELLKITKGENTTEEGLEAIDVDDQMSPSATPNVLSPPQIGTPIQPTPQSYPNSANNTPINVIPIATPIMRVSIPAPIAQTPIDPNSKRRREKRPKEEKKEKKPKRTKEERKQRKLEKRAKREARKQQIQMSPDQLKITIKNPNTSPPISPASSQGSPISPGSITNSVPLQFSPIMPSIDTPSLTSPNPMNDMSPTLIAEGLDTFTERSTTVSYTHLTLPTT
eukprot:TRINITY_DN1658_c0_g1_i2.p1 TRINITY_DN1658_c0_g1~~TRINITY_DN1658_c0_g1_i2.p1  ORF type:complete len:419 (+),score=125.01 TRINITY_DN1658_c0_g1_i2:73-1257(+)